MDIKAELSENSKSASSVPRMSVNKLAEYMEANPKRRKKIVYDAKYPQGFIVTRYREARDTIKQHILNKYDEDFILNVINELEERKPETDFQKQDIMLSIEALELFLEADISSFSDMKFMPNSGNELIQISGVDISVQPDLIIVKEISGGKSNIGGIKLHLSKINILTTESQKIVGAMLYRYTLDFLTDDTRIGNPKLCFSFDIFSQSKEVCPSSYKVRMQKIEAACEEIALWWEKL